MNILTPSGYKDITVVNIGEQVVGYDMISNQPIINVLLSKELITPETDNYSELYGDFSVIVINGSIPLYKFQSVFTSTMLVHADELQVGDIIYDDAHNGILINSLSTIQGTEWWRLGVSGDHSYIADNILLHNPDRYWVGGGSSQNWNATGNTNWSATSGGSNNAIAPGASDVAIFNSSGNSNSTISAAVTIAGLNIVSGYTSTLTHSANLTVGTSGITLNPGYTIAGGSRLIQTGTGTLNFNGVTWPYDFELAANSSKTLASDITITGTLFVTGLTVTLLTSTARKLYLLGGLTNSARLSSSQVDVYLQGGTWSQSTTTTTHYVDVPLFLDGNITVSGANVSYGFRTLTYVSGIITTTGSILNLRGGNCTFNTPGVLWGTINNTLTNLTLTLASDLDAGLRSGTGNFVINTTTTQKINCYGVSGGTNTTTIIGTADLYLKGGTYSSQSQINKIVYIDGNPVYSTNPLRIYSNKLEYLSGDPIGMGFAIYRTASPVNIDLKNQRISYIDFFTSTTSNILSPFSTTTVILRNCLVNSSVSTNAISVFGPLTTTVADGGVLSGVRSSTKFIMKTGSKTQRSGSTTFGLAVDIDIDGDCIVNSITFNGVTSPVTIRYISGNVTTSGDCPNENSAVKFTGSVILDTAGMSFSCIYLGSNVTMTLLSTLTIDVQMTLSATGVNYVFAGTHGWVMNSPIYGTFLTLTSSGFSPTTITLQAGVTYVLNSIISQRNVAGVTTIQSSDPVQRANLCLVNIRHDFNYIKRFNTNFVRIDASCGQQIWTNNSTVTDCLNIQPYNSLSTSSIGG